MRKNIIYKLCGFLNWMYQWDINTSRKSLKRDKKVLQEKIKEYQKFKEDYNMFIN